MRHQRWGTIQNLTACDKRVCGYVRLTSTNGTKELHIGAWLFFENKDQRQMLTRRVAEGGAGVLPGALMRVRLGDILFSAVSACNLSVSPPFGSRVFATNWPAAFASAGEAMRLLPGCTRAVSLSRGSRKLHLPAEACGTLLASAYPETSP